MIILIILFFPLAFAQLCSHCTYVSDERFISTDLDGHVLLNASCQLSAYTKLACKTKSSGTVHQVRLTPFDTCKSYHYVEYCFDGRYPISIYGHVGIDAVVSRRALLSVVDGSDIFSMFQTPSKVPHEVIFKDSRNKFLLSQKTPSYMPTNYGTLYDLVRTYQSVIYGRLNFHFRNSRDFPDFTGVGTDGTHPFYNYEGSTYQIYTVTMSRPVPNVELTFNVAFSLTTESSWSYRGDGSYMCLMLPNAYTLNGVSVQVYKTYEPTTTFTNTGFTLHCTNTDTLQITYKTHSVPVLNLLLPISGLFFYGAPCPTCRLYISATYPHVPSANLISVPSGGDSWLAFVTGCPSFVKDPIDAFIDKPTIDADRCIRIMGRGITHCYKYSVANTHSPSTPQRIYNANGVLVGAIGGGYKLGLTLSNAISGVPQPLYALGTFSFYAEQVLAYIYETENSFTTNIDGVNLATICPCKLGNRDVVVYLDKCSCIYDISPFTCLCNQTTTGTLVLKKLFSSTRMRDYTSPLWFVRMDIPVEYKPKLFVTEISLDIEPPILPDCELFLCNGDSYCMSLIVDSPFRATCSRTMSLLYSQFGVVDKLRHSLQEFAISVSRRSDLHAAESAITTLDKNSFLGAAITGSVGVLTSSNAIMPKPENQKLKTFTDSAPSDDYWTMDARTGKWETIGLSAVSHFLPGVGIGILATKLNKLADRVDKNSEKINQLIENQQLIADSVVHLQNNFNSLLDHIDDATQVQVDFNGKVIESLNNVASELTAFIDASMSNFRVVAISIERLRADLHDLRIRVSVLELLSSRAMLFNQYLNYLLAQYYKFQTDLDAFQYRAKYCTSLSVYSNSFPCLHTDGEVVLSSLSIKYNKYKLSTVALIPSNYKTLYVTDSFCSDLYFAQQTEQVRMYVARPGFVYFLCSSDTLCATAVELYQPMSLSDNNTLVFDECVVHELYLEHIDFTYDYPDTTTVHEPFQDITADDVLKLKEFSTKHLVNYTELVASNQRIANLTTKLASLRVEVLSIGNISKIDFDIMSYVSKYSQIMAIMSFCFSTIAFIHVLLFCFTRYKRNLVSII